MTETELRAELKNGRLQGAYYFYGCEDYLNRHYTEEVRKAAAGGNPGNVTVFRDESAEIPAIVDAIQTPSLFSFTGSQKKLIEAIFVTAEALRDKKNTAFLLKTASDAKDTVLLLRIDGFDAGTEKKPTPLLKQLMAGGAKCVEFAYQSETRLIKWLERHAASFGLTLPTETARLILRRTGRSMFRLQGEIEKAAAFAASHGMTVITKEAADEVVTKTDDEDAFRLANCLLRGNTQGALACLDEKIRRKEEPVAILGQITGVFCDLAAASAFAADGRDKTDFARSMGIHPYRAELYYKAASGVPKPVLDNALDQCGKVDRLLKSTTIGYIAIERLLCAVSKAVPRREERQG